MFRIPVRFGTKGRRARGARHADEHVRAVAENPLLRPSQQTRSKPLPTTIRPDAEYLHVAAQKTTHVDDDKTGDTIRVANGVYLFHRIGKNGQGGLA